MIPNEERIGIASCGVVSALGVGWEATARALVEGRSGIAPVALFDTQGLRCHTDGARQFRDIRGPRAWHAP